MKYKTIIILLLFNLVSSSQELIIGEERVEPGIIFIFEGAVKDHIMPVKMHLAENETNVHIEARVNWDSIDIPKGAVENGFIPYLYINAKLTNERTGISTFIDLLPHINLIDNFHYARNIVLPGAINDKYSVKFNIIPPTHMDLALHKDWSLNYGEILINETSFSYTNINFEEIAKAKRK
tara:strand:+ start:1394 stop:1933 length:540 start_codon:yes stop_codon:yes gene_type:complete